MQLRFLIFPGSLNMHFARLVPLFEQVVRKAVHGEFSIEDLYLLAQQDRIILRMVEQDAQVQFVFAFEFIAYLRFTAINILALAGRGLGV